MYRVFCHFWYRYRALLSLGSKDERNDTLLTIWNQILHLAKICRERVAGIGGRCNPSVLRCGSHRSRSSLLSRKVRSARDRTIRTFQIRVRSKLLESKENHEKHRREKNHFNEAAFDPKYKKGPHERREKGNKLH